MSNNGGTKMKVKEFMLELKKYNPEAEILISCDEELNTLFQDIGTAYLESETSNEPFQVVIWGNSGSEV